MSKIEWTEKTWNPVTGCMKLSPGCKNCYAERMAKRLRAMGQAKYAAGFVPAFHPHSLREPAKWKQPTMVFVCSMSDLFQDFVPDDVIHRVFDAMRECPQHTFQVLTKRSWRLLDCGVEWPSNVWAGVTVETASYVWRIDHLRDVPAPVRFLSCEPLLEDLGELDLRNVGWVIAGGESGPDARPMHPDWARSIRDQCVAAGVPFFFKQHGGVSKKKAGRELDGRTWDEMPDVMP